MYFYQINYLRQLSIKDTFENHNKTENMKHILLLIISVLIFMNTLFAQDGNKTDFTQYVDPFIGTQGGGNTFPGTTYPFGMVKLGPDCDDLNSNMGYKEYGKVRGFSHLHVSGTGGGCKYGNILVYPFMGEVQIAGYGLRCPSDRASREVSRTVAQPLCSRARQ